MREDQFRPSAELYRPLIGRPVRQTAVVSSREVGRGGVKFMGRTISGVAPAIADFPEDRDWGYHDDGTTVYLVYNRLGVINYIPISAAMTGGPVLAVQTVSTTPFTVTDAHDVLLVDATAGAITLNLHAVATARKKIYNFKKIDASANSMVLEPNAAELIDGAANITEVIPQTSYSIFPSTEWRIL